jgi:hypothetical protein
MKAANEGLMEGMEKAHKRHQRKQFWKKFTDDKCSKIASQNACDAADGCTWCRSMAVKSKCYTVEDAAKLPAGVFACDNQPEEEVAKVEEMKQEIKEVFADAKKEFSHVFNNAPFAQNDRDVCEAIKSDQTCDANPACAWCQSVAVRPSCKTVEDAKALPSGVFYCPKVAGDQIDISKINAEIQKGFELARQDFEPIEEEPEQHPYEKFFAPKAKDCGSSYKA